MNDHIVGGLQICLKCYNSRFCSQNLLQLNGTATGAPNSCLHSDLDVFNINKNVLLAKTKKRKNTYQEMQYFGQCRHDCLLFSTSPLEKFELFLIILNSTDSNLQYTMEVGGNELRFLDLK